MRKIEFLSYDGSYPSLCTGALFVLVDGEAKKVNGFLFSGGKVCWTECFSKKHLEKGAWEVSFCGEFFTKEEQGRINKLVNDKVPLGCCGGCL